MGKVLFMRKGETHTAPKVGLPDGYTELAYIQSSGTQYIDTLFKANQDTKVVMDGHYVSTPAAHDTLFGGRTSATAKAYAVNYPGTYFRYFYNGEYESKSLSHTPTERCAIIADKNNITIGSYSHSWTYGSFQCEYNLLLFAMNNAGQVQWNASARVYSCQIYDNGTLVRDFIPCINPSGAVGLYDKVTKAFFGNAGTGVFSCDLDFANQTWEQIIERCQTNTVPSIWNVGDSKPMTINGTEYLIDIIGKNHDTYSDGSGKAPLTFQMHDCYGTTYQMNGSNTNSGGWTSCVMRTTHLPAILALMPSEVQSGIKEVNKLTSAGAQSDTINTTADKLFLLSSAEIRGESSMSYAGEGVQYAYYTAGNSKIKKVNGTATNWYSRSPYTGNTTGFVATENTGGYSCYEYASRAWGVSFAFCF